MEENMAKLAAVSTLKHTDSTACKSVDSKNDAKNDSTHT
jgi:hypothetical protein